MTSLPFLADTMIDAAAQPLQLGRPVFHSSRMWIRISALLILVVSAVLIVISFLNYSNYRKTFLQLNLSRYLVVANDLRQTVEAGLNIGLEPDANARLLPAMQELTKQQAGTRFIAVLQSNGAVINEGAVAPDAVPDWQHRMHTADSYWQANRGDNVELGMIIRNNFNLKVGAVVIGYDRLAIEDAMAAMRRKLLVDTVQILAAASVLILLGVNLITRKLGGQLESISRVVDRVLTEPDPPLLPEDALDQKLADDVNMFANLSHRALRTFGDERAHPPGTTE
jgi:hypothetical protein